MMLLLMHVMHSPDRSPWHHTNTMGLQVLQSSLPPTERPSTLRTWVWVLSCMNSHVSLQVLLPCKLFRAVNTWTGIRCLPCVTSPVSQQVLLPCESFPTVQAVVRSLWFNAHVQLYVPVEMLSPTVCLGTPLIGTMQLSLSMVVTTATTTTTTLSSCSTLPLLLLAK